jgi:hypothetical protein
MEIDEDEEKFITKKISKDDDYKIRKHIINFIGIDYIQKIEGPYEYNTDENKDGQDEKYKTTLNNGEERILYVDLEKGLTCFRVYKKSKDNDDTLKCGDKRKFDEMNNRDSGRKSKRSLNRKSKRSLNRKSIKRSLNRKSIKRSLKRKSVKRSLKRKSVKRSLNRKSVYTKNDLDKLIGLRCLQKMTLKNGKSYIGHFGSKEYLSNSKFTSESGIYGIKTYKPKQLILAKLEDIIKVSTC